MSDDEQNKIVGKQKKQHRLWWLSGGLLVGLATGATGMWQFGKLYVPPTQRGIAHYKNGLFKKAVDTLLGPAEEGDGEAQYWLARCLIEEAGGSADVEALR